MFLTQERFTQVHLGSGLRKNIRQRFAKLKTGSGLSYFFCQRYIFIHSGLRKNIRQRLSLSCPALSLHASGLSLLKTALVQGIVHQCLQQDDMHNGDHGSYTPSTVIIPAVPATDNSPAVPEQTTVETILNMSPENKAHFKSEKEVIHLILTGIRDEIYLIVDACKTTHEMWEAIERLQQGVSLNIQDVKTTYFEYGKFTSPLEKTMDSFTQGFYKLIE
ncbi:hypothetical protein Tco_0189905 [Tanacetum coccineum]